jgi:hypothetical protein
MKSTHEAAIPPDYQGPDEGGTRISSDASGHTHQESHIFRASDSVSQNPAFAQNEASNLPAFFEKLRRTARLTYPKNTWRQKYHRFKYILRSIALLRHTRAWLKLLEKPYFRPLVLQSPRLHVKLQRPYLLHGLKTQEKLAVLNSHFCFLEDIIPPSMLKAVCTPQGLAFHEFSPKEDQPLRLSLRAGVHEKEGELSVTLEDIVLQLTIQSLFFSITSWGSNRNELQIGGVQGIRSEYGRTLIAQTTRAMFGMRPKSLLLHCLIRLAVRWGIQRIRAVSNSRHVCRNRLQEIGSSVDFDTFWNESDGSLDSDGLYTIPLLEAEKELSVLKASKRAMYRKRTIMLQGVDEAIASQDWAR